MRDNYDDAVEHLAAIRRLLGDADFGDEITNVEESVTVNHQIPSDQPDDSNTPTYFSTGKDAKVLEPSNEWERIDFGFVAGSVNIRTTEDVLLAFSNPNRRGGIIPINGNESPFTIGGANSINTAFLWVQTAEGVTNDAELKIIAYE